MWFAAARDDEVIDEARAMKEYERHADHNDRNLGLEVPGWAHD